jgi:hypothetical protein
MSSFLQLFKRRGGIPDILLEIPEDASMPRNEVLLLLLGHARELIGSFFQQTAHLFGFQFAQQVEEYLKEDVELRFQPSYALLQLLELF